MLRVRHHPRARQAIHLASIHSRSSVHELEQPDIGRSENAQPLQSSLTSSYGGQALPNNVRGNLPPNAHGLPSANSDGKPPIGGSFANLPQGGHVPSTFTNGNILPQNVFTHPANIPPNSYPFYTHPMYTFPNMPAYANPNSTGLFPNPLGSVRPFVLWIEDYPLLDGLKMPSHIGSYDGKGDPDNFLHLFEGAIRIQKWLMLVACHIFTYTLKDSAKIRWNSQKAGDKRRKEERRKASIGENLYPYGKRKRPQAEEETYERQWDGRNHVPPISNEGSSDPVVIKVYISGRQVNKAYLDSGSSCEVICEHCFLKLKPSIRSLQVDSNTPLVGFSGEESWPLGEVSLEVTNGEGPLTITKTLTFVIVRSDSPHNLLLGRRAIQEMGIVVSTVHGYIKFHTPNGIGTIFSEHNSQRLMEEEGNLTNNGQGDAKDIFSCIDTKENIVIDDEYPKQKVTIGRQLPTRIKMRLRDLLRAHADVFAWTTTHITGVMRTLIIREETFSTEHQLNVFNHTKPVKQKKRSLALKRNEAVHTQVEELVEAGVLREVKYQTWVSNPIIVKKDDGKWKLRIDFTNINKACIREPYPLPAAELGVENLHKYRLNCFLDAYKGYHQIPMANKDEE
ncbi:reverse transcriptase domain-containing protein [Tanacetum coccineum]